jgi:tetratricopeptide (TPR) repeat protein/HEAT repeat protein
LVRRIALALALLTVVPAGTARADWEVKRSAFDPTLVARYKQLLRKNPNDADALKKLVALYRNYRSLTQLESEYEKSHEPADLIVRAHLLRDRGKLDEAAALYGDAFKSGDRRAILPLADVDVKRGKLDDARKLYDEALADEPRSKPLLQKRADVELNDPALTQTERARRARPFVERAGDKKQLVELDALLDPKKAVRDYGELVKSIKDPLERAQALLRMGTLAEHADDTSVALQAYQQVYTLAPKGHYLRAEAIQRIIDVSRKRDELRALVEKWEKEWPAGGRSFVEWDALAKLWDELGDVPRAEASLQRAVALSPETIEARQRLIALYDRQGKDAEAAAECRKLVRAAPGEPRFRLELAERLWRTEPGSSEARELARAVGASTRDPSVHLQLAELYGRWRLDKEALAEREKLVALEPDDEAHLVNLGELYYARGDKTRALETWKRILSLKGDKREKLEAKLGDVYAEHELPNESLEAYQRAVKLAPDDPALQKGLAGALERVHRDAEALTIWERLYEKTVAQRALQLDVRQHLIAVLLRLNQLNSRLPQIRQRLATAATDEARAAWGLLASDGYLRLQRPDEAERVLRELTTALKAPSLQADAYLGLAQVLKARHRLKDAITALEKAAELEPSRARELYAQIAELSLKVYRDADALSYARKAVELGPGDAMAQLRLAEVLEKRDQLDEAAAAFRRALELNDRQWKVYFVLARLELRRGDPAAASSLYRLVIRRAPEEELVVDAARRAIDLDEYLGTLGDLERELAPLSYAHPDRRVYRNLLVDLYGRYAPPLVARARAGDAAARKELTRLGEHGLRPLLEVLESDDGSTDATARRQAAMLLGEFGNPSATEPLLKLARSAKRPTAGASPSAPPSIDLRVEAALAGARLAGPREAGELARLAEDPEKLVRVAALYGLERVRAPAAESALVKALGDVAPEAQATACLGLARQNATRALPQLYALVKDRSRSELARAAGAVAIGALAGNDAAQARKVLAEVLVEGADLPQEKAAWALGRLGARASAPSLIELLFVRREPVRRMALDALAGSAPLELGEPERLATVDGGGLAVRAWVASLGLTATHAEIPASSWRELPDELARALGDALSRHRDLQLRALGDLDARTDGLALGPLTMGPPDPASRAALDELGARLRGTLERLAGKADVQVRARAIHVLAKVRGGLPTVVQAVSDPAPEVRLSALDALSTVQADAAADAAQAAARALGSRDWRERRAALAALSAMPTRPLAAAAVGALDDPDGFVREAAARTLGHACAGGRPCGKGLDALARRATDEAAPVRAAVAEALRESRQPGARTPLDRLRKDPDPAVRAAAVGD